RGATRIWPCWYAVLRFPLARHWGDGCALASHPAGMLISRLPFRRVRCCHVVGGVLVCAVAAVGGGRAWCQSGPAVVPAQAPPPSVPLPALPTVVGGDHTVVRSVSGLFMNRDDGFFARVGGLGDGNGVAVGGGYRLSTSEGMLTTRAMVSHREAYLVSADWRHRLDR